MKTHFKKLQNPNYLGSWDLADANGNYQDRVVTLTSVKKEMVHDGKGGQEECVTVQLKGLKPIIANSTNLKAIVKATGSPFIEDWAGKQITLTVKKIKAFGDTVDAIRVNPASVKLPELTPTHPKWAGAKASLADKSTTIETIRTHFTLTPENEALLTHV